jgi:hypothetical protein
VAVRPSIDYVYLLGASHSGSTLLAMLLNAHPDIVTIGETAPGKMGDVHTYRCSCGRLIPSCPFWTRIAARMRAQHPGFRLDDFGTRFEFPSNRLVNRLLRLEHRGVLLEGLRDGALRLSPHWQKVQQEVKARCYDLASAVLSESGGRIFVDSSKLAHRLKFLLRITEFRIKVIHLVRDGRAVALTYMKQDEFADAQEPALRRGGRGMAGKATANALPMAQAAMEWRRCLRSAEHVLAGLDDAQWMQVRYEELCHDTRGVLRRIHDFLGTDYTRTAEHFRDVEHHVIGNGMRLDSLSEIRLDERWRQTLTERDLLLFHPVAGEINRSYGYF